MVDVLCGTMSHGERIAVEPLIPMVSGDGVVRAWGGRWSRATSSCRGSAVVTPTTTIAIDDDDDMTQCQLATHKRRDEH